MAGNGIIGETGKYKEENRYIHGKIVKGIAGFYYVYGEDNSGKVQSWNVVWSCLVD